MKIISLAPEDERLLRAVCVHESGHAIVAQCFGLEPKCYVAGPGAGAVRHNRPRVRFEQACVSWGGPLAEDIAGARYFKRTLPSFALNRDTLRRWATSMILDGGIGQLSQTDRDGIEGYKPSQIESAEYAFALLDARRALLEWRAEKLADEARPRFMASLIRGNLAADGEDLMKQILRNEQ